MKPEYKEKVLSNFESMAKRIQDLNDMVDGKRPGTDVDVKRHLNELKRLLENSLVIVDVS
jgi:hypothetical protein